MIDSVILNKNLPKKEKILQIQQLTTNYRSPFSMNHNKIIVKNKEVSTKKGSH